MDANLEKINAFQEFLSEIVERGYNNDESLIKLIVKHIDNYMKEINENDNNNTFEETNNSEETEEEEEEEEKDEDRLFKEKIQLKIDKFMKSNNDLSKIYLYKNNNFYKDELNQFIDKSYIY